MWQHIQAITGSRVLRAIQVGALPPVSGLCVDCGRPAKAYDHRDYDQPMAVEAVCHRCNQRRGPAAFNVERWLEAVLAMADAAQYAAQLTEITARVVNRRRRL